MKPRCVALLAAPLIGLGCSSDDDSAAVAQALGNPTLTVVQPKNDSCVVLYPEDEGTLRLTLTVTNWWLRPPGYCGTVAQCGHVVVFVDETRTAEVAALVADVPMTEGSHTVRVELRDDEDQVGKNEAKDPLSTTLRVDAVAPGSSCEGDAGALDAALESDAAPETDAAQEQETDAANEQELDAEAGLKDQALEALSE